MRKLLTLSLFQTLIRIALIPFLAACSKTEALKPLGEASLTSPPETMSVRIKNYRAQPGKTFQHLFVSNFSVNFARGQLLKSTSRDGMADSLKLSLASQFGFDITGPETRVPGFADLLLWDMGVQLPAQALIRCVPSGMLSSSNDGIAYNDSRYAGSPAIFLGLRDCEKNYLSLDPRKFSNSGDGMPDYLKLRCGLNPSNPYDAFMSTSGDGVSNLDKCKWHIPLDERADSDGNILFRYNYDVQVKGDGSTEFLISNISILDGGKDNFLVFYLTETDLADRSLSLYTAFAILKSGYAGKTLQFSYWGAIPATFNNQEILVP